MGKSKQQVEKLTIIKQVELLPADDKRVSKRGRRYWLFKTEPDCFSIQHLADAPQQTTFWSGVRNYQARNMLRDEIKQGDGVLLYHSSCDPMAIVGTCTVVREGYPDHTAYDKDDDHYDPKSTADNPTWYMVDIRLQQKFREPLTRDAIKDVAELQKMMLLQRGSRLSIQPVTEAEWKTIHKLAGAKDSK